MTLQLLLIGILIAAFLQPTVSRVIPALLYAFLTVFHYLALDTLPGPYYYYVAGAVDFLCMALIYQFAPRNRLSFEVTVVCFVSILINAVGWILYMAYLPPHVYNVLFVALYLWAIAVLLKRDWRDVGKRRMGSHRLGGWIFGLRASDYSRLHLNHSMV